MCNDCADYGTPKPGQRRIKIYDFKRPDKFSKEQIRTMQIIHDTFARLGAVDLSMNLGTGVKINVASVDQLTYEEFIRSIPNPTSLCVINMYPIKGSAIMEVDPQVYHAFLECLMGTPFNQRPPVIDREHSDLESEIMAFIYEKLLVHLKSAWCNVLNLMPTVTCVETVPAFAQIVPPNEMVVLVTFEVEMGTMGGMINMVFPYLTLEPIINRLSASWIYSIMSVKSDGSDRKAGTNPGTGGYRGQSSPISMDLVADALPLSVADLEALKPGSMVELDGEEGKDGLCRVYLQEVSVTPPRPPLLLTVSAAATRSRKCYLALGPAGKPRKGRQSWKAISREQEDPAVEYMLKARSMEELESLEGAGQQATAAVEQLGAKLESSLRDLGNRIGSLQARQDSLADQLLYGGDSRSADSLASVASGGTELGGAMGTMSPVGTELPGAKDLAMASRSLPGLAQRPFSWIQPSGVQSLVALLQNERPALVSLILSFLDEAVGAQVLDTLPDHVKTAAVRALLLKGVAHPDVVRLLDTRLAVQLANNERNHMEPPVDSLKKVVGLLNLVTRETEKTVIETLDQTDAAMSEEIKRLMFVFEDIGVLDDKSLALVLTRVDLKDLALAVKGARPETAELVRRNLEPGRRTQLTALLEGLGKVRLSDVGMAEQRVVECIRQLEAEGGIVVVHPDDLLV